MLKFKRYTGVNGNDDTYVRYVADGLLTPNEIAVYVTKHWVSVDECDYTFKSLEDIYAFRTVLERAWWQMISLRDYSEVADDEAPYIEIVENEV